MDPEYYNSNTKSSVQKEQNYSFASKVPQRSMLKKLDLNWTKRLEELFNNTDDQNDYFEVYSEGSNTSISTIRINSNESRYNDSFWSDTDVTRRDDIVIQLSESAFYNTKVNPFPQLKFPPSSSSERNETDRNNKDLTPTGDTANGLKDLIPTDGEANEIENDQINKDSIPAVDVTDNLDDIQTLDVVITEVEDENNNVDIPPANDVKEDHGNPMEALPKSGSGEDMTPIVNITDDSKDAPNNDILTPDNLENVKTNEELDPAYVRATDDLEDNNKIEELPTEDLAENDVEKVSQCEGNNSPRDSPSKEQIESIIEDNQNGNEVTPADNDKNNTVDDQCQDNNLPSNNQSKIEIPIENVSPEVLPQNITPPEVTTDAESTILSRRNSGTSRKSSTLRDTMGESSISTTITNTNDTMKKAASEPQPSFSNANSQAEQRKKRYRTRNRSMGNTVDTNNRRNVKRLPSQSSGCTEVTSTTTVHVTTNDDAVFDALADMPDFINSSVIDLASSYIDERLKNNQRKRLRDFDSDFPSSVSSTTPSWRNERMSSVYDDYLSPSEAYKQLNELLSDGTRENLKAVTYDEYNDIRFDDEIPSSEEEFMSDVDDLDLINQNWTAPESELRRQVAKILRKLHPLETDYGTIINDMLCKYVSYIDSKQRIAKINRIVEVVDMPITQQEKTELLIRREIDDKKLNRKFYYSQMEPPDFTELAERRREAIVKKYSKCHNDRVFCHDYFERSIDDRPISKLGWRLAKLKKEMGLIFA